MRIASNKKNFAFTFLCVASALTILILSVCLYFERVILLDTCFQLGMYLIDPWFWKYTSRFTAVIPFIPAALAADLGVGLNSILVLTSISFACFHLFILGLIAIRYQNFQAALLLICTYFLSGMSQYYFPVSDLRLALSLGCLFYCMVMEYKVENRLKRLDYFILLCTVLLMVFAHPVALGIILSVLILSVTKFHKRFILWCIAVLLLSVALFALKSIFIKDGYAQSKFGHLIGGVLKLIRDGEVPEFSHMVNYYCFQFPVLLVVFIINVILLIKYKSWYTLGCMIALLVGYQFFVVMSIDQVITHPYDEHMNQLAPFLLYFVLLILVWQQKHVVKLGVWGLVLVIGVSNVLIQQKIPNERIIFYQNKLIEHQNHGPKYVIKADEGVDWQQYEWMASFASLFVSCIDDKIPNATFCFDHNFQQFDNFSDSAKFYNGFYYMDMHQFKCKDVLLPTASYIKVP